jgi:hypothetical protein
MNAIAALLIFFLLRFPTSAHHIVFEEIGEMARALSYIHAIIPVNISGLDQAANIFCSQVADLRRHYNTAQAKIDQTMNDAPNSAQKQLAGDIKHERQLQETFLSTSESEADNLLALIDSLKGSLPKVNEAPTLAMSNPTSFRIKRGIGAMLLQGIFGTFMGLYNRQKLSNLCEQVETVAARQNRLLQITEVNLQ